MQSLFHSQFFITFRLTQSDYIICNPPKEKTNLSSKKNKENGYTEYSYQMILV